MDKLNWNIDFFIWVLQPIKIISLILSQVSCKVGWKWEIPEKKHLTARKQNLACLRCDPSQAPTHSDEMTSDLELERLAVLTTQPRGAAY